MISLVLFMHSVTKALVRNYLKKKYIKPTIRGYARYRQEIPFKHRNFRRDQRGAWCFAPPL